MTPHGPPATRTRLHIRGQKPSPEAANGQQSRYHHGVQPADDRETGLQSSEYNNTILHKEHTVSLWRNPSGCTLHNNHNNAFVKVYLRRG